MPQVEAKKPIEGGIKDDIGRQHEAMKELFNGLRETVSRNKAWDTNPRVFFKELGEKLGRAGIDEMKFSDFITSEVETIFRISFGQAAKADAERHSWSKVTRELTKREIDDKFRLAGLDEDVGTELLTIAYCLYDAASCKLGISKYFEAQGNINDVQSNRAQAGSRIYRLKSEETDAAYRRYGRKVQPIS